MPGRSAWAATASRKAPTCRCWPTTTWTHKLARIPGLARSHPDNKRWRMEMTRWGLGPLKEATGVGTVDVANRMADYGVDPWWMSHEPWVVPEPFTPEAGEMYGKEELDYWIAVVERICEEAQPGPGPGQDRSPPPADRPDPGCTARGPEKLGDDLAGLRRKLAERAERAQAAE